MSDRYDVRKLKRDWAARLAAGEKPRSPRSDAIERQTAFEQRTRARLIGARVVVNCNHNVPWLDCRVCSKPRGGR